MKDKVLTKTIEIPRSAVELLIQLSDAAEMAHHSTIARHDIIEKLIDVNREQLNCMNETFRAWRDELKNVKHETDGSRLSI